jgi:acyl CoA:acetate/3-ketoacid CoA transferase beta subunit
MRDGPPSRAEVCAAAIADCFARDGEILANPIGTLPVIGGRLAKATVAPELVMTDGEALLVENILPVGVDAPDKVVAGWNPYRTMFDVVWSGRRHVMMGASQIDKWGNQNFAFIGDHAAPRTQLLGMRGAPGNTINDKTSYWIPAHSTRVFVPSVDVVSGVGYDRATDVGAPENRFHELGHVVTNLCVCDFATPEHRLRLRSLHPGVSVDDVVAATGFGLAIADSVPETRLPTDDELRWIREVIDPNGLGEQEVPS